jgi:hypothetical protein
MDFHCFLNAKSRESIRDWYAGISEKLLALVFMYLHNIVI